MQALLILDTACGLPELFDIMKTIKHLERRIVDILKYPEGFTHAACGCDGCLGIKGDCIQAKKVTVLNVAFILDDGTNGVVVLPQNAIDLDIEKAITKYISDEKKKRDPLIGKIIK